MKKLTLIIIVILLSLVSCENKSKKNIKYDKNGNIIAIEYTREGKLLDSIVFFKNDKISMKMFFKKNNQTELYIKTYSKNGKLKSEGNTILKEKIGKWKYYYDDGKRIVEYKIIKNKEYPNQIWTFNKDGKLNLNLSSFYSSKIEGEQLLNGTKVKILKVKYVPGLKNTICTINLSQKINKDYSNIDSVEKFTLRSDNNYIFTIPLELDSTGKKITVIGYIDEHFFDEKTKNLEHSTKRTYISIPINKL